MERCMDWTAILWSRDLSFAGGLGVWCFGFLTKKQPRQDMPYGDEDGEAILWEALFLEGIQGNRAL
jgi:hypothetical protein